MTNHDKFISIFIINFPLIKERDIIHYTNKFTALNRRNQIRL